VGRLRRHLPRPQLDHDDRRDGAFTAVNRYERPGGMPNLNNEGLAIAPLTECTGDVRPVFYSDDSDTAGNSLRQGTVNCTP
jgi:hypothetical protein